jgi:hypothetical protein
MSETKFIRKNGKIIPIKAKKTQKETEAVNTGLKWGIGASIALTPIVGIPLGFYKYNQALKGIRK